MDRSPEREDIAQLDRAVMMILETYLLWHYSIIAIA